MIVLSIDPGHNVGFCVHDGFNRVLVGTMRYEHFAETGLENICNMFPTMGMGIVEAIPSHDADRITVGVYIYCIKYLQTVAGIPVKVYSPGTWKPLAPKTSKIWFNHAYDAERLGLYAIHRMEQK